MSEKLLLGVVPELNLSVCTAVQESGQPGILPLDMEAWADAVLDRCLVIVEAMETPDNRSADRHSGSDAEMHASFLLATDVSMFRCARKETGTVKPR